jgi:hypothetical protein
MPPRLRLLLTVFPRNTITGYVLGFASLADAILSLLVIGRILLHETWSWIVAILGLVIGAISVILIILRMGRLGVSYSQGRLGSLKHANELALTWSLAIGLVPLDVFMLIFLIVRASDLLHPFNYSSLMTLLSVHLVVPTVGVAVGFFNFAGHINSLKRTIGDAALIQELDRRQTTQETFSDDNDV